MKNTQKILCSLACSLVGGVWSNAQDGYLVFEGDDSKPGKNNHVVLIAGDEEYRSEEAMPMMAQILADQGFKCTVLFSLNSSGFVDPTAQASLSQSSTLDSADAIVMAIRFRNWPDDVVAKFNAAFVRGVPISALRTSTHPFNFNVNSKWAKWNWSSNTAGWKGGFGRQVLGETWVSHWGKHAVQGMRTYSEEANAGHPVLNGVEPIFCRSDLYEAKPLAPSQVIVMGQITETLERDSKVLTEGKAATHQPCAWVREYEHKSGVKNKIFTTTMGSADDLTDENLRRLVINSVYYNLGLEVPQKTNVSYKSNYEPSMYGFKNLPNDPRQAFVPHMKPSDYIDFVTPER